MSKWEKIDNVLETAIRISYWIYDCPKAIYIERERWLWIHRDNNHTVVKKEKELIGLFECVNKHKEWIFLSSLFFFFFVFLLPTLVWLVLAIGYISISLRLHLQNDDEQQRMLIDILKQKYPRQHVSSSSSSAVSTPMMVKTNLINYQFDIYVCLSLPIATTYKFCSSTFIIDWPTWWRITHRKHEWSEERNRNCFN